MHRLLTEYSPGGVLRYQALKRDVLYLTQRTIADGRTVHQNGSCELTCCIIHLEYVSRVPISKIPLSGRIARFKKERLART